MKVVLTTELLKQDGKIIGIQIAIQKNNSINWELSYFSETEVNAILDYIRIHLAYLKAEGIEILPKVYETKYSCNAFQGIAIHGIWFNNIEDLEKLQRAFKEAKEVFAA